MKNLKKLKKRDRFFNWLDKVPAWEVTELLSHYDEDTGFLTSSFLPGPIPLQRALERRQQGEPLEYILQHCHVDTLTLALDHRVLIPRPETETLARRFVEDERDLPPGPIVDCGTGSGFLAGWIRQHTDRVVVATDLDERALQVAVDNSRRNSWNLHLLQADRLAPLKGPFAGIVSNLPYVEHSDSLMPSVRAFEPHRALFVPGDGDLFYREFLRQAQDRLLSGGELWMELKPHLARELARWSRGQSVWCRVDVLEDTYGRERFLRCRRR